MELKRGQVVRALAGRDKGGFFAVLKLDPPWAEIADGKRRPLERPKRKKLMHMAPSATVLRPEDLATNRKLRAALRAYRGETSNQSGEDNGLPPPYDTEV